MDRQNTAILLTVQLHLPVVADQVAGLADAPGRFLQKLGSLARLALSAGVQKRDFLRKDWAKRPGLAPGFLLDRARLLVQPVGLDWVVATLLGQAPAESDAALDFGRRIVGRLRDVLSEDGRSRHLEVGMDGTLVHSNPKSETRNSNQDFGIRNSDFGFSTAARPADIKDQVRVAADLHETTHLGTVTLRWCADAPPGPEEIVSSLHWLWKRSQVGRVRLARGAQLSRQIIIDS